MAFPSPPRWLRLVAHAPLILVLLALALIPAPSASGAPVPNNIVGLNLARLKQSSYVWAASDLVNANGGEWGYITITWTIEDRETHLADYNLQQFLDRCFEHRVQPIIRVGTRFDPGRGTWVGPEWDEPAKWRAFFERASWPNRRVWIIAGNEPNLGREWSGEVDAAGYAQYLAHFVDVFQGSDRFRVVNAPLDISNGTDLPRMQDALQFIDGTRASVPNIFERLPAWASNPYRVPSGGDAVRFTHRAYEAELDAIGRDMPVLITESHIMETDDAEQIAAYFDVAFRDWMADPRVIAATPLFWHPDKGQYWMFSLDKNGGIKTTSPTYHRLRSLPRVMGSPEYVPAVANTIRAPKVEVAAPPAPSPTPLTPIAQPSAPPPPAATGSDAADDEAETEEATVDPQAED